MGGAMGDINVMDAVSSSLNLEVIIQLHAPV